MPVSVRRGAAEAEGVSTLERTPRSILVQALDVARCQRGGGWVSD